MNRSCFNNLLRDLRHWHNLLHDSFRHPPLRNHLDHVNDLLLWEARSRPGRQGPQRKCAGYLSTTSWKMKLTGRRKNRMIRETVRKEKCMRLWLATFYSAKRRTCDWIPPSWRHSFILLQRSTTCIDERASLHNQRVVDHSRTVDGDVGEDEQDDEMSEPTKLQMSCRHHCLQLIRPMRVHCILMTKSKINSLSKQAKNHKDES